MFRSDYVLVWLSDTSNIKLCSLCRVPYHGSHCPGTTHCVKDRQSQNAFDNTKHTIIATKEYCKGLQYNCTSECETCVLPNTYPTCKVME